MQDIFASDRFRITLLLLRRAYRAPSNAEKKESRRSRLFEVAGRLIGVLMIYGSTGGDGRGLIF